jgi:hypothetical protein
MEEIQKKEEGGWGGMDLARKDKRLALLMITFNFRIGTSSLNR